MLEVLSAFPVMVIAGILQATVFSHIHILNGSADLILLMIIAWSLNPNTSFSWLWAISGAIIMTYLSAISFYGYFLIYGIVWLFILFLKTFFWQMPLILMLLVTIFGSLTSAGISYGILNFSVNTIDFKVALTQIIIPSLTLNLLLAIPVYGLLNDLASALCPRKDLE